MAETIESLLTLTGELYPSSYIIRPAGDMIRYPRLTQTSVWRI